MAIGQKKRNKNKIYVLKTENHTKDGYKNIKNA